MSGLRSSRVAPRLLWALALTAAPLSRRLAGAASAALWFTPWQRRSPEPDASTLLGPSRSVRAGGHEVVVYERGQGPAVLLVHGWADRATSMAGFVEPLVAAGHRVVAVDLPAHGAAPGRTTDALEFADTITALVDRFDAEAIVAHSLGGLATTRALRKAPSTVRRVVLISPAAGIEPALARYSAELRLPPRAVVGLRAAIARRFSDTVWRDLAADHNLRDRHDLAGLIVHDIEDRRVGIDDARRIHEAWPGSRLVETRGLGHNRLLRDPAVIDAVIDHVRATDRAGRS